MKTGIGFTAVFAAAFCADPVNPVKADKRQAIFPGTNSRENGFGCSAGE